MRRAHPETVVFYYHTDPDTAERVAAKGFEGAGIWTSHASVTLLDQPLAGSGGALLRVALPPDAAASVLKLEPGELDGQRTFVTPLELVRNAYITIDDHGRER